MFHWMMTHCICVAGVFTLGLLSTVVFGYCASCAPLSLRVVLSDDVLYCLTTGGGRPKSGLPYTTVVPESSRVLRDSVEGLQVGR